MGDLHLNRLQGGGIEGEPVVRLDLQPTLPTATGWFQTPGGQSVLTLVVARPVPACSSGASAQNVMRRGPLAEQIPRPLAPEFAALITPEQ